MNLYKYSRVYSYDDCEDLYLIKADNEEDALNEVKLLKENHKAYNMIIDIKYLELIDFKNSNIAEL